MELRGGVRQRKANIRQNAKREDIFWQAYFDILNWKGELVWAVPAFHYYAMPSIPFCLGSPLCLGTQISCGFKLALAPIQVCEAPQSKLLLLHGVGVVLPAADKCTVALL